MKTREAIGRGVLMRLPVISDEALARLVNTVRFRVQKEKKKSRYENEPGGYPRGRYPTGQLLLT